MLKMRIAEYLDSDAQEVILEITSGENTLYAYACPFRGFPTQDHVTLSALFAWNIGPCKQWHAPQRIPNTPLAHHLCGEIVDVKDRIVRIGDMQIILDTGIDSSLPVGSLICFDVSRIDY